MNEVVIKVIGNYSYQTSRCLGEGVYGKVYEGMERETKQKVAIKKIDLNTFTNDKYLENAIFSEIYLLKRFNHPNIVRFKDVLSSKNSLYIITEFCKNGDLKQLIKRKRFREDQAFDIMRQLLSGFSELVRQKIIHRDLKPANILINDNVYKIGDFGFAKYVDNFGSQMLKSCVGSPIYMAPQILERTQYTTKCDIWSLGIIFYEMIHGFPPWKARDQTQLLRSIKNVPIAQLLKKSALSQRGNQFLRRTLAFSEEERIAWAQLFETFGSKQQKLEESQGKHTLRQKQRVNSSNTSSGMIQTQTSQQSYWKPNNPNNTSLTSLGPGNSSNSSPAINTGPQSPYPHGQGQSNTNISTNYYSTNTINTGIGLKAEGEYHYGNVTSSNSKRNMQVENAAQMRQFLVYYHFYCVQMFSNLSSIHNLINKGQFYSKLLFNLASLVKNRSTFCLSMIVMHSKLRLNKNTEQLYRKMQVQHEGYQALYNDIIGTLQRCGHLKSIKIQYINAVGHVQIISEQRMQKMQSNTILISIALTIGSATENAQILSEQVKKRLKTISNRDYFLVQALDIVLDILRLALGKGKSIKEIQSEERDEDEDIKDYVARVFGKVDRLSSLY